MIDRTDDGLSTIIPVGNLCETAPTGAYQSDAHLLTVIESFLLSRQVGNCASRTLEFYRNTLERFARFPGALLHCDQLLIQGYFTHLRDHLQPVTAHGHFRALKVFFGWCVETAVLSETPMGGCIASTARWERFEEQWNIALRDAQIPMFQATDFFARKVEPFKSWSDREHAKFA